MNILTPQTYVASLQSIKPSTIAGQRFIDESANLVKTTPFTNTLAYGIVNNALQSVDPEVQAWGKSQLQSIDESFMSFHLQMLCESAKYDGTIFSAFKPFAKELCSQQEADIVRAIAVDGVLNKYTMVPEIKQLIAKAKNIVHAKHASNLKPTEGEYFKYVEYDIAYAKQISAQDFVIATQFATFLINSPSGIVNQANNAAIMAAMDTDMFQLDINDFTQTSKYLTLLMQFHDDALNAIKLNLLNMDFVWYLEDNKIELDGVESSIDKVNAAVMAKASVLQTSSTTQYADLFASADTVLPALNKLYAERGYLVKMTSIVRINNGDSQVFVAVRPNPSVDVVNEYTVFVRHPQSTGLFKNVYTSFEEFAKMFVNPNVRAEVAEFFSAEINAEQQFSVAIAANNAKLTELIAQLQSTKAELEKSKELAPESSLTAINAQIMTIDDLIARNQAQFQSANS